MSSRLAKTNTGKAISWRSKVSVNKKVSCSMSCKCYLISKRLLKRNNSRVMSLSEQENNIYIFVPPHLVAFLLYVYFLLKRQMIGFNFAHELLWTTWFKVVSKQINLNHFAVPKGKSHSLVKIWQGKKHTSCRANLNWFFEGSTVVLKLNLVLYRVKVQYLLTAIIV